MAIGPCLAIFWLKAFGSDGRRPVGPGTVPIGSPDWLGALSFGTSWRSHGSPGRKAGRTDLIGRTPSGRCGAVAKKLFGPCEMIALTGPEPNWMWNVGEFASVMRLSPDRPTSPRAASW